MCMRETLIALQYLQVSCPQRDHRRTYKICGAARSLAAGRSRLPAYAIHACHEAPQLPLGTKPEMPRAFYANMGCGKELDSDRRAWEPGERHCRCPAGPRAQAAIPNATADSPETSPEELPEDDEPRVDVLSPSRRESALN